MEASLFPPFSFSPESVDQPPPIPRDSPPCYSNAASSNGQTVNPLIEFHSATVLSIFFGGWSVSSRRPIECLTDPCLILEYAVPIVLDPIICLRLPRARPPVIDSLAFFPEPYLPSVPLALPKEDEPLTSVPTLRRPCSVVIEADQPLQIEQSPSVIPVALHLAQSHAERFPLIPAAALRGKCRRHSIFGLENPAAQVAVPS